MDETVEEFRRIGRLLTLGITVKAPRLPRSMHGLETLKREAAHDPRVRRALEASLCDAELARHVQPQTIKRDCGQILAIR